MQIIEDPNSLIHGNRYLFKKSLGSSNYEPTKMIGTFDKLIKTKHIYPTTLIHFKDIKQFIPSQQNNNSDNTKLSFIDDNLNTIIPMNSDMWFRLYDVIIYKLTQDDLLKRKAFEKMINLQYDPIDLSKNSSVKLTVEPHGNIILPTNTNSIGSQLVSEYLSKGSKK